MNPKNFPPAAGSHSKIVYLKASPGGITSKNDNQWKNKLQLTVSGVEIEYDVAVVLLPEVYHYAQGVDH